MADFVFETELSLLNGNCRSQMDIRRLPIRTRAIPALSQTNSLANDFSVVVDALGPAGEIPLNFIAAFLFEAAKLGFSLYIENFSNYEVVFGSLSAVVIFLFWVFISANIMLFGAEVASEYPRVMRGDYDRVHSDGEGGGKSFGAQAWGLLRRLVIHDSEAAKTPGDKR